MSETTTTLVPSTTRLEAIYSKPDFAGNCYWAFRYTDLKTGKTVEAKISGSESNIAGIRFEWSKKNEWDRSICFDVVPMAIRAFDRLTKGWPYAGCSPEELRAYIKKELETT